MALKNAKGNLSISRPSYGGFDDREFIEITFRDCSSGTEFVTARVKLDDFARALTGLGHLDMSFDFYPELVGKKYEHKTEIVPRPDVGYNDKNRNEIAAKAFAPFEVEGWKGRVDDLFNSHMRTKEGYRVIFTRYVEAQ